MDFSGTTIKLKEVNNFILKKVPRTYGRPIRLADVLAALRETNVNVGIDKDGLFIVPSSLRSDEIWGWNPAREDYPVWDIYHDDLRQQNAECIDFIWSELV